MTPPDEGECKLLSDVIQERFGLSFAGVRRDILLSRLRPRLTALRLPTLLDYYHFLRCHPDREAEFERLSCQLTNNETYFFREPHHFAIIATNVVAALGDTLRTRPLRVLSAGCSSGEEPYSLAIALHDAALGLRGIRWEIDACDLNRDRIARAREGVYEGGSLRACDAEAVRRHFESQNGGRHRLRDRYRKSVRFFEANLATPGGMIGFPPYDVVLCRNLLIYFDDAGFDRTIRLFARALAPGGWLFLGHSESLIDRSDEFVPTWLEGAMIYRKRLAEAAA
jgi:chemotaxis protein methyltransferase CheR